MTLSPPRERIADDTRPIAAPNGTVLFIGSARPFSLTTAGLHAAGIGAEFLTSGAARDVIDRVRAGGIDAVIAPLHKRGLKLFAALRALDNPPLLIGLVNTPDPDLLPPPDLLTLSPPAVQDNLPTLIRLHRRASAAPPTPAPTDAELLKTMIVKTVSHELRTPLLQVKSAVALLTDSDKDRERLLGYAMESLNRLEHVVGNITRLAESLDIHLEPASAHEISAHAMRLLRRSWEGRDKSDRVVVEVAPDLPLILCDRGAISVALQLLLDNALKFSSEPVHLSIAHHANGVVFQVVDRGIGIPVPMQERIFEPFFQIDHAIARKFGGSGVGLAIVRLILDRHRVRIHIDSVPGAGSTFSFILPAVPTGALPR